MYSSVVIGLPKEDLEAACANMKEPRRYGRYSGNSGGLAAAGWRVQGLFQGKNRQGFPGGSQEQLWGAIGAVFESWMGEKAVTYRRVEKITGLLGTAVNVVQMVSEIRGRIPARACASRATLPPARRFSSAIFY